MARGMSVDTRSRIDSASQDFKILNAPIGVVMNVYELSHANAQKAVQACEKRAKRDGKMADVLRNQRRDKLVRTVLGTEDKYPGLLKAVYDTRHPGPLTQKWNVTRQRLYQIKQAVKHLGKVLELSAREIVENTVAGRLPKSDRELLEKSHKK